MKKYLPLSTRIYRSVSESAGKPPHPHRPALSRFSYDDLVVENEVLGIIEDTANPMEPALDKVADFLTPNVVTSILEQKKGDLEPAFRFFLWASRKNRLRSRGLRDLVAHMLARDSSSKSCNLEGFDLFWKILDEVRECDSSVHSDAFTALILAYWKIKKAEKAIEAFSRMREFNCKPNVRTFNAILHVMVKKDVVLLALAVYNVMLKTNLETNCSTFNILIDGLCKGGMIQDALNLFDEMSEKGVSPSKTTYTVILSGLCQAKKTDDAHRLFNVMKSKGCAPDNVTYSTLLNGFCRLGRIDEAFSFLKTFGNDGFRGTLKSFSCLVDGLIRANRIDEAHELFLKIFDTRFTPDLVLYTIMMKGLSRAGRVKDAIKLLTEMTDRGIVPDTQCYNTLIKGFCDAGLLDQARSLELEISKQDMSPDTCTYTILICGMCRKGLLDEARTIFSEMEKLGCLPSVVTFNSLISGLCKAGDLEKAKVLFCEMEIGKPSWRLRLSQGADRVIDSSSLQAVITRYCESGMIVKAYKVLRLLADDVVPNIITYNILINGFCKAGNMPGALKLLEELKRKGHTPDKITYGTIIDGLYRNGHEEGAAEFFDQMSQNSCPPGPEIYKSLMTWSCRKKKVGRAFVLWLKYLKDGRGEENERITLVEKHLIEENFDMVVRGLYEIDCLSQSLDSAPYNICLVGLCQAQNTPEALKIFSTLKELDITVSGPSCVMLIQSLCDDAKLEEAISVFLYTTEIGFRLMPRVCNNLLKCLLQSEEKAERAFYLLKEMKSVGYNLEAYIHGPTKSLISEHNKLRKLTDVLSG